METNNEEMYYPRSPTRFVDDEEELGESLFVANNNSPTTTITGNPFDVPTTSTISGFGLNDDGNNNMEFNYTMNESILPPQPQLAACSHSYPDNINEFSVENLDELMPIGKVFNVVEKKITIEVMVDKNSRLHDLVSQNNVNLRENNSLDPELIRKQLKLQVGALLFTKEGKPIGKITDIFGTVTKPFYVLTYPDISTMRGVFNIPKESTTSSSEPITKKEETVAPPSTPTKQKSDKLSTPKKTPNNITDSSEDIDDFFDIPDPRDLKVIELKPYLQRRGLSPWGKKKNMIAKIRKFERDKRKKKQKIENGEESDDDSSNSDSESSSSEEEGETLFTPKKQVPTTSNGEKFALRTLKDLEGMESDDEEHDTKKDDKKANNNSTIDKLSPTEIAKIKESGLIYCHNVHSAQLDVTSTQHMILNHTKAYDAMFNSDEKTEVMTFSDDEDESAFKHQKKEERKNPPPPVPVLKRKYDEALITSSTSEEKETESLTKVSKKLPFIDISEAKQQEKANSETTPSQPVQSETENIPTISETPIVEEKPKPQTPKQTQNTKSTPKSRPSIKAAGSSSAARKPRVTAVIQTSQDEEPSFLSKWCLIM